MENILISIIVPIYNAENYLNNCISSILHQEYENFELILINDGSTDETENICLKYKKQDSRIKYYFKNNGGVSSARNYGLNLVSGSWICFVDADDVVDSFYLSSLASRIPHNDLLIFYNYTIDYKGKRNIGNTYAESKSMVRYYIDNLTMLSAPYAKLFNSNVIKNNHIQFPEGVHMGEDAIFILRYLNHVNALIVSNESHYLVKDTENSLSTRYNNFSSEWLGFTYWLNELKSFICKYGYIYENNEEIIWKSRIAETFYRCLQSVYKAHSSITLKQKIKMIQEIPEYYFLSFKLYYQPITTLQKINKFLITNKLYAIFITLGHIYELIKRKTRL